MEKLSVIIPMYNSEKFIEETLSSVEDQSLAKDQFEIIVYDDYSRDGSLNIVRDWSENNGGRLEHLLVGDKNKGCSFARNVAIEVSQYDWIINLDSDDLLKKNALLKIQEIVEKDRDLVFGYSGYDIINEEGEFVETRKPKPFCSENLLHFNVTGPGIMFFSKYIWEQVGGFDEEILQGQDWDFVLGCDFVSNGNGIRSFDENLFSYRKRSASLSTLNDTKDEYDIVLLKKAFIQREINVIGINNISPHPKNSYYFEWTDD